LLGVADADLVLGRVRERAPGQRDVAALWLAHAVDGDHELLIDATPGTDSTRWDTRE
jgi:hypothetical protein